MDYCYFCIVIMHDVTDSEPDSLWSLEPRWSEEEKDILWIFQSINDRLCETTFLLLNSYLQTLISVFPRFR